MPQKEQTPQKTSRLQKAMALYGAQVAGVLEEDETAPEGLKAGDLTARFNVFANLVDPSHDAASQYKYLDWICHVYLERSAIEKAIKAEDLSKIKADLRDFKAFSPLFDDPLECDINHYKSYDALLEQIIPYQQARDARKAAKAKVTQDVEDGTIVVYDGPEGKIVRPITKEACQFWGMGTRWCISATESENYFDRYHDPSWDKHIYIFLPVDVSIPERKRLSDFRTFKYAGAGKELWNEHDDAIHFVPPCLDKLIKAAESCEAVHDLEHLRKHGEYTDLPSIPDDPAVWDDYEAMLPVVRNAVTAICYVRPDLAIGMLPECRLMLEQQIEEFIEPFEQSRADLERLATGDVDLRDFFESSAQATEDMLNRVADIPQASSKFHYSIHALKTWAERFIASDDLDSALLVQIEAEIAEFEKLEDKVKEIIPRCFEEIRLCQNITQGLGL